MRGTYCGGTLVKPNVSFNSNVSSFYRPGRSYFTGIHAKFRSPAHYPRAGTERETFKSKPGTGLEPGIPGRAIRTAGRPDLCRPLLINTILKTRTIKCLLIILIFYTPALALMSNYNTSVFCPESLRFFLLVFDFSFTSLRKTKL